MGEPALSEALIAQWSDRRWRLENLYYIQDKHGNVVLFKLNEAQRKLLDEMHYLNIILKARQMGFSTFILLLALDCCLFNSNFAAGLVADTKTNAQKLLARIKFAYERLPAEIRRNVALKSDNTVQVEFDNGSGVEVGVSLRSGTFNFLHVSEYGKICAKAPDKAKEVKSGTLNTLAPRQLCFIESTAEGRAGDFYDKTQTARAVLDAGRALGDLDYRFHFFAWWQDPTYMLDEAVLITVEDDAYFESLRKEHGITLTYGQKWWYAAKKVEQGDDMWKEFPSTPDEAFKAAREGAYFGKEMRALRLLKRIGNFPFVPKIAVNTFWDFGQGDNQTIWLHQSVAGEDRFVGYFEDSGMGLGHYFNWLEKWAAQRGAVWGVHYAPHDVDHRRHTATSGKAETIKTMAADLGYRFVTVERSPNKQNSIQAVRSKLPGCCFDEAGTAPGIVHLENYSRDWDDKLGVWRGHPRHDEHSHGADGFMTFTDGYKPQKPKTDDAWKFKTRKVA
ncbi:terminase [Rhizobium sp. YJ-22]|uniref:terminase n=1 Tax=Rhizobium sp. YJ-22 TaxID=3037556 RepID=UPI0024124C15|nr:terminase [Rhizobium sp. YJ-22]MDG3577134.1 terminase [Rhizobium sp. YJ-22]